MKFTLEGHHFGRSVKRVEDPAFFEIWVGVSVKIVLILLMEDILHRDCESHIHRASNPHPWWERKGHIPAKI